MRMLHSSRQIQQQESCGLKNSGCVDKIIAPSELEGPQRFSFVDGASGSGRWTLPNDSLPYKKITCPVGGFVVFNYPQGSHDVIKLENEAAYENCNLTTFLDPSLRVGSDDVLSPRSIPDSSYPDISYYFRCTTPGAVDYLTCSVPGHCEGGQKVVIETSATEFAYNETTSTWNLHVTSLARLLVLLGYRRNPLTKLFVMDRGYQTEDVANETANLIWCGLDHCPEMARDFVSTATQADCESMVLTLLGFVQRKRPIPQWNVAQNYYSQAIAKGGANECAARSYKSQLYMTQGNYTGAVIEIEALCGLCNSSDDDRLMIRQARVEYDRLLLDKNSLAWPDSCLPNTDDSSEIRSDSHQRYGFNHAGFFLPLILLLALCTMCRH